MKIVVKILKTLFIFTIIVSLLNVYGYNLKYKGYTDTAAGTSNTNVKIRNMTEASQFSVDSYSTRPKVDGWVIATESDKSITGGPSYFDTSYYVFAPLGQVFTQYSAGFQSSSTTDWNNVYYDKYDGYIQAHNDSFVGFTGEKVNIKEHQDVNTSGHLSMRKNDYSKVELLYWKVIGSVRIDVYSLTPAAIASLRAPTGPFTDAQLNEGIRMSSIVSVASDSPYIASDVSPSYLDTAWTFFQGTVGHGWSGRGRGFVETFQDPITSSASGQGTYRAGATVANEYDNILVIPTASATRNIYINHVDETGAVLPGFQNSSLNMVPSGTRANDGPMGGFQEHYTITGAEQIAVRKSSQTAIGTTTYTFQYGKAGAGDNLSSAITACQNSTNVWAASQDPYTFGIAPNNVNDVLVVNLVYSSYSPPPPAQALPDLQIIGRLCFINTNSNYSGSTSGGSLDYIPSTKTLTPYAEGAYPYAVRAIRYDTKFQDYTDTAKVTVNIDYSWQWWEYEHHDEEVCSGSGDDETCSDECTSACGYYTRESSDSMTKYFEYTVPYRHTYFDITNFKMYRITKLEVYDTPANVGGTLFGGGTYTINPSGDYEARFGNGKIDRTIEVTFPDEVYTLPSIYKSSPSPSSGESAATTAAQAAMDAVTAEIAADHEDLRITYEYDNDYVELDGTENMLQRNYRTWNEHINKETDAMNVRDLDSRKTGSGSANTGNLDYTSNLMTFMKPPAGMRTTDDDFAEQYKQVPANRENGIRHLKGKIFYSISTNPKYNVGSETFTSTDATYTLNNPVNVTNLDFVSETKDYVDNDVNKVNVFTPVNFGNFQVETARIVDHTGGAGTSTVLQKNADFTITPDIDGTSIVGYSLSNTREFVKGYYFIFDFNIIYEGNLVNAFTPIYRAGNSTTLEGRTTDSFGGGAASQITNSVKVVAITTNVTDMLKNDYDHMTFSSNRYMDSDHNQTRNTGHQNQNGLLTRPDIVSDAYHAAYRILTTKNIGRIFDFAVTDCSDLAFEDVFRKPNGTNVNETSSVAYYSGYKKWNLYSSEYNEMVNRPDTEIGTTPKTTLPLGPYKNTNIKYVNAPKMGYRISYDLKTTGYIGNNNLTDSRRIEITPNYYYISKDGRKFDNNITLYYKNSSNNYVNFASSGYTIYFKPNDGYRYLRNREVTDNDTMMSFKLEPLTISNKITLTRKMMSINNTSFIQSWYGEFKLPNSTIAKSNAVGNINNNINNPYKDGYIGVRFDIRCIDVGGETVIYDTRDKSANAPNTSQWDYEGFMNFKTPGSAVSASDPIRVQLEKDMWVIYDTMYQNVKGTVVLFDLDNRAANDFE